MATLVTYCSECEQPLTTAAVIQHFADTAHDAIFSAALASADDHEITPEIAAGSLAAGVARYRQQARRAGLAVGDEADAPASPEEAERLRQLEIVRRCPSGAESKLSDRGS